MKTFEEAWEADRVNWSAEEREAAADLGENLKYTVRQGWELAMQEVRATLRVPYDMSWDEFIRHMRYSFLIEQNKRRKEFAELQTERDNACQRLAKARMRMARFDEGAGDVSLLARDLRDILGEAADENE
jgi:hypothetical protein